VTKQNRAQLKLHQKYAFQSDHNFNEATELCYAIPDKLYITGQEKGDRLIQVTA
jgi:hypothetical protein